MIIDLFEQVLDAVPIVINPDSIIQLRRYEDNERVSVRPVGNGSYFECLDDGRLYSIDAGGYLRRMRV